MDKYDLAIKYLSFHPEEIHDAWNEVATHRAACLFKYCTLTGKRGITNYCGCLTQIRLTQSEINPYKAFTDELTEEIRKDSRIPCYPENIGVSDLPVFAEWQRRMDAERERLNK